jgi:hypothetical protein
MLIENAAFCNYCFETVHSKHPEEINSCKCKKVFVAGGLEDPMIYGTYTDLSWSLESQIVDNCIKAIKDVNTDRNRVLEVLRALRMADRIIGIDEPHFIAEYEDEVIFSRNGEYVRCVRKEEY